MIEKRENKLTKFGTKPPDSDIVTSPPPIVGAEAKLS